MDKCRREERAFMEESIWANLPEHLLEQIIIRLPIASLLRCRCLSKKWLSFISSLPVSFQRHRHRHLPLQIPRPPWFLMFVNHSYQEGFAFDPATASWYCISLPSFSVNGDERHIPVASAGGLICFTSSLEGRKTFTVCNPITRSWRRLPSMLNPPAFLETVGMVIVGSYGAGVAANGSPGPPHQRTLYNVVVAGNHEISDETIFTEVFDSGTLWQATSRMPGGADPMLSGVACNGALYSWCCEPDGLLSYDLKNHSWTLLPTSTPHSTLVSNAIISWHGRLFMLGGLNENQVTSTISVWELVCAPHSKDTRWVVFDTMPPALLHELLGGRTFFMCVGCEGMVLLHLGACSENMPMLLYDIDKKSWQKLPLCPSLEEHQGDGLLDGIAFIPEMCATP
ncbi:hypothetical protein KP509_12G057600 [Ceratopteris richardii]|nr:hypothetical protein KP509_12G057500 [Ceratopteris richardii]KAH7423488.1 hypothetical protein KP509_12G057600 [Ceratopteris richardii]